MPQLLLVEGVRDGGVTNNSKSYIETYMKEKERGAFAALLKCNSRVVLIFVNILCVCIITYSVIWIFLLLKTCM